MELLLLLESSPMLYVTTVALVGLMVGSFLNVVIHRVPLMMDRTWSQQCREHLEMATEGETAPSPFNLLTPASRCPHCGHRISAIENIPVISYLALRGRCRGCDTRISPRYPVIELVTAVLSAVTVIHFGFTLQAAAALALWSIYHIFKLLTGKEGMGYGDFKLLGAIGAWVGWQALPVVILFSSVVGALTGIVLIALRSHGRGQPIPFGPFLAAAGWITLLWGQDILAFYLG